MIVTVRIYKRHDPDLVHLIENYEFDIKKAVYCALSGYIKGEAFVISLPKKRDVPYKTSGRIIRGDLRLNEMEDEALIRFISQIPGGERNCALKTILRLRVLSSRPGGGHRYPAGRAGLPGYHADGGRQVDLLSGAGPAAAGDYAHRVASHFLDEGSGRLAGQPADSGDIY